MNQCNSVKRDSVTGCTRRAVPGRKHESRLFQGITLAGGIGTILAVIGLPADLSRLGFWVPILRPDTIVVTAIATPTTVPPTPKWAGPCRIRAMDLQTGFTTAGRRLGDRQGTNQLRIRDMGNPADDRWRMVQRKGAAHRTTELCQNHGADDRGSYRAVRAGAAVDAGPLEKTAHPPQHTKTQTFHHPGEGVCTRPDHQEAPPSSGNLEFQ